MSDEDALLKELREAPRDNVLWQEFYTRYYRRVFLLTFRLCAADIDLAEEVAQDAFVRFLLSDAIEKVESSGAATAYLRAIVRNLVRDHYRSRAAHPTVSTDAVDRNELERALDLYIRNTITSDDAPSIRGLRHEDRDLLRQIMEGLTITEISERLGLSYSAAAVRVHRLRKQLRRDL